MLACTRSSVEKAIGLLERGVSSSTHSLKQANELLGYVGRQQKVQLLLAAMSKPPSPSTGASPSSSSFFSAWQLRSSSPRHVKLLGAVGVLGAAMLYSLSGYAADESTEKSSRRHAVDPYFNRLAEQTMFKNRLNSRPGVVTVLFGPADCGKTRFLTELAGQFEADATAPPFLTVVGHLALSTVTSFKGSLEAEFVHELKKDEGNFKLTIKKYGKILEALESLAKKPVIVIDEANNLMDWKQLMNSQPQGHQEQNDAAPQPKQLLNFLVYISKEKNLAHVILATSDYFLASWLAGKGLAGNNFGIEVLGDLTEEEAREFFLGDGVKGKWAGIINNSSSPEPVPVGAEEYWPAIYDHCGGNIGLLLQCLTEARVKGNWNGALKKVVARSRREIKEGFTPKVIPKRHNPPLWTAEQWAMVLESITATTHHAVPRGKLAKDLGKGDQERGKLILLSMVEYNLLALRPDSELARDLPEEVYGGDEDEVVTFISPAHAWSAKKELLIWKNAANRWAGLLNPRNWLPKAKSMPKEKSEY